MSMKPVIVVVVGTPGSGKTTIGFEIARQLNLAVSDKDTVTGELLDAIMRKAKVGHTDYGSEFAKDYREAIYGCTENVAKDNLKVGMGTVIIAPYAERGGKHWRDKLEKRLGGKDEINMFIIFVHADEHLAYQRIKQRGLARDTEKLANWEEFSSKIYWGVPDGEHLLLNAEDSFSNKVRDALQYIKK